MERVAGLELSDYQEDLRGKLAYIGAHRSKGMDFLGVILIDPTSVRNDQRTRLHRFNYGSSCRVF